MQRKIVKAKDLHNTTQLSDLLDQLFDKLGLVVVLESTPDYRALELLSKDDAKDLT